MASSTIKFSHKDNLGNKFNENLVANPDVINMSMSSETAIAVDNFVRNIVALTNDLYDGVTIQMTKDITEWSEE